MELYENKNTAYQNLWSTAEAIWRREWSQFSNPSSRLKTLNTFKPSKRKEIINIKAKFVKLKI
jgi:hypothetical protein